MRPLLESTLRHALAYLDTLPEQPVAARASLAELRKRFHAPLPDGPTDPAAVVDQLVRNADGGLNGSVTGRFFGWVIGGHVPAALAADWLTSTWDQNAGMYAVAPAAAIAEEAAGQWLLELLDLPDDSAFAFVTGCQMAHVTCLAAARHRVLARFGWDAEQDGLYGAPPITILTGDQRHGSIERALHFLGMGSKFVHDLPTADDGQLKPDVLAAALEETEGPTILLLQAGDLNTGSSDPYHDLIPLAREYGAWTHVDGAFGLWAKTSAEYRHLLDGVELADSWAVDGHKWLNVPYDSGYAIVADRDALFASMSHRAAYLAHSDEARDPIDWNPEYSRRARGFATWAAIRSLGRKGIAEMITASCHAARDIVEGAAKLPGVEVLARPIINQGLLRFRDPKPGATDADHDRRTDQVAEAIRTSGEAFFACTTWRGKRAMRVSVSDWRTGPAEVERTVRAIAQAVGISAGR